MKRCLSSVIGYCPHPGSPQPVEGRPRPAARTGPFPPSFPPYSLPPLLPSFLVCLFLSREARASAHIDTEGTSRRPHLEGVVEVRVGEGVAVEVRHGGGEAGAAVPGRRRLCPCGGAPMVPPGAGVPSGAVTALSQPLSQLCHSPAARAEPSPPRRTDQPRTAQNGRPGSEAAGGMAPAGRKGWRRSGRSRGGRQRGS